MCWQFHYAEMHLDDIASHGTRGDKISPSVIKHVLKPLYAGVRINSRCQLMTSSALPSWKLAISKLARSCPGVQKRAWDWTEPLNLINVLVLRYMYSYVYIYIYIYRYIWETERILTVCMGTNLVTEPDTAWQSNWQCVYVWLRLMPLTCASGLHKR
jgi:hypothetical protein